MASAELVIGWALLAMFGYILAQTTEVVARTMRLPITVASGAKRRTNRTHVELVGGLGVGLLTGPVILQVAGSIVAGIAGGGALAGLVSGQLSNLQVGALVVIALVVVGSMMASEEDEEDD